MQFNSIVRRGYSRQDNNHTHKHRTEFVVKYNLSKVKTQKSQTYNIRSLKDNIRIKDVAAALGVGSRYGRHRVGDSIQGNCPKGHSSGEQRCFSIDTQADLFHCFSCHVAGDIIQLVMLVKQVETREAIQWLVEKFDPKALASGPIEIADEPVRSTAHYEHQDLFKLIYEHGKDQLHNSPDAQLVREYLQNDRGYDPALLSGTEFIYLDNDATIRSFLTAKAPEQAELIKQLPLHGGYGDNFRLAIPFRDMHGVITGFLKRAHVPLGFDIGDRKGVRWDSTKGLTKPDPFGMHRIHEYETLLVVEGYPDATYLPAVGIDNIVSLGQAAFSKKYIDAFEVRGVKRLVLGLDNDDAGYKSTENICELLNGEDIQVFVIDPSLMGIHKDPDCFVKVNGVAAMKQLMHDAEHASTWMVKRLLSKSPLSTAIERDNAIGEVFEYCDSLDSMREAEMGIQQLASTMNLPNEALLSEYQLWRERAAAEALTEGFHEATKEAEGLLKDGKVEEALRTMQDTMATLQSGYQREKAPEIESFGDFLSAKKQRDSERGADDRLGYKLTDFEAIDTVLRGLQTGLYIIAADPNIGKTAFQVSLLLDVLKSNDDVSCLFYSMDDSRDMIVNRCLAHLTDVKINDVRHRLDDFEKQCHLDAAYQLLAVWGRTNRLDIHESSAGLTMTRIASQIREHPRREKLVVLIDGLYNVPLEETPGGIREENIERATQVKQIVREFDLPMIVTAEFRKQGRGEKNGDKNDRSIHDIMETGKYGYNADLIMLLSPKDPETYGSEDKPNIVANFGKNKLESFKGTMEFEFDRAKSVMRFKNNSFTEHKKGTHGTSRIFA
jgi:replicative DNA helicase